MTREGDGAGGPGVGGGGIISPPFPPWPAPGHDPSGHILPKSNSKKTQNRCYLANAEN